MDNKPYRRSYLSTTFQAHFLTVLVLALGFYWLPVYMMFAVTLCGYRPLYDLFHVISWQMTDDERPKPKAITPCPIAITEEDCMWAIAKMYPWRLSRYHAQRYLMKHVLNKFGCIDGYLSSQALAALYHYRLMPPTIMAKLPTGVDAGLRVLAEVSKQMDVAIELIFSDSISASTVLNLIGACAQEESGSILKAYLQILIVLQQLDVFKPSVVLACTNQSYTVGFYQNLLKFCQGLLQQSIGSRHSTMLIRAFCDIQQPEQVPFLLEGVFKLNQSSCLSESSFTLLNQMARYHLPIAALSDYLNTQDDEVADLICQTQVESDEEFQQIYHALCGLRQNHFMVRRALEFMPGLSPRQLQQLCAHAHIFEQRPLKTVMDLILADNNDEIPKRKSRAGKIFSDLIYIGIDTDALQSIYLRVNDLIKQHNLNIELDINNSQSTHTASVHQTTTHSALQLKQRYDEYQQSDIEQKIRAYLQSRNTEKSLMALDGLNYLIHEDSFFIDPVSQITLTELLCLVWCACEDETLLICDSSAAKSALVEGLYEIQRGYAESDASAQRYNSQICLAGCFNKLIEKLRSVHPDVEQTYITNQTAALKFPCLVHHYALEYLKQYPHDRAKVLAEGSYHSIWTSIEAQVHEAMYAEFNSLYTSKDDAKLIELMQMAEYVTVSDRQMSRIQGLEQIQPQTWWPQLFSWSH